jgi:diguanylate cyclase (GGDEF)-like protein/PAS domain S-box-containing protein
VNHSIKLLLVEDLPEDSELLVRTLRKGGLDIVTRRVQTCDEFAVAMNEFAPDLILSDYTLPGFDGMEALRTARETHPDTPFIFVSGTIGEERAIEALKQGAVDYVLKDNQARLVPAIKRALSEAHERQASRWALRELAESEERFRSAMRFSSIGMALIAPDGRWLAVNPALCRLLAYSEDELLATNYQSITHADDLSRDENGMRQMLARGIETYKAEKRYVRKDGGAVWTLHSVSLVWLQSGEPNYFICQIQDISDRVRAERDLQASEERFRSIAEATQEWIWEIDANGMHTFCSPAVEAILGFKPAELIGVSCLEIVCDDARPTFTELLRTRSREKRGWRDLVIDLKRKDGGIRSLDYDALPLLDADGTLTGFRGVARDVTVRRQQADRIARLSRIQAVLSGINSTIVRVRNRDELFRESCRIAVQQGGFRMAWIGLAEPGETRSTPVCWDGYDDGYLQEVGAALADDRMDPGMVGQALRQRKVMVANDIANDPQVIFKREALARGYRSHVVLPLVVNETVQAVLVLYAAEVGFFDHEELKLLKDLAGDISFALDYIGKEERLSYVSYYDTLTGLANRQLFFDRLSQALAAAKSERRRLALMTLDLQRFKNINDTIGRSAGDRVLKAFAARMIEVFGNSGMPARIGGNRFAVIMSDLPKSGLPAIDNHDIQRLLEPFVIDEVELRATLKIGIAVFPSDAATAETLFVNAEAALKLAKRAAETYLFYSPEMNARVAQRLHQESRLRKAVENKQLFLHYQPKVDLVTRRVSGLEALIRWRDPESGLVPPLEFIPLLEESGLIIEVGRWLIEQALADSRAWRARRKSVPRIAVNVSEMQLRHAGFVMTVLAALGHAGECDSGIDLEITESLLAQNTDGNVQKLQVLRKAGMRIHMDDFGTGYSGLSQIAHLPLDALKIDRAFIVPMTDSAAHLAIVSAIVNMAKALGISVIAEGVETEGQARALTALGCPEAQGFLFSEPLGAAEIEKLLPNTHEEGKSLV